MYKGNDYKKSKMKTKKALALLISVLLVVGAAVGGTIAYMIDKSPKIDNVFTPSEVTTTVVENFDGKVKENVQIQNTGDTTAWIRAAVVITWKDESGNVYGTAPVAGTDKDYTITYDLANGWVKGADGFYYYTKPVKSVKEDQKNCTTGVLIKECKPLSDSEGKSTAPDGYSLRVEIIGSAIQSVPSYVFNEQWESSGLKVNSDGTALETASV